MLLFYFLCHRKLREINLAVMPCSSVRKATIGEHRAAGTARFFAKFNIPINGRSFRGIISVPKNASSPLAICLGGVMIHQFTFANFCFASVIFCCSATSAGYQPLALIWV